LQLILLLLRKHYAERMHAPAVLVAQFTLAIALVIFSAYAAGRVHQWYRHSFEREVAYRDGYNQASQALFHLAIRTTSPGSSPRTIERETAPTRVL